MRRISLIALPLLMLAATGAKAQDRMEHKGHAMSAEDAVAPAADTPADAPAAMPAPDAPEDHAADAFYNPDAMARARETLRYESGGMPNSMLLIDRMEWRPGPGAHGYAWEIEGWTGGDIDRLAIKSKAEGSLDGRADEMEFQLGWLHAIDPWFNVRAGVRQDLLPRRHRTYAVLAVEGLAPYWFELEGEIFLSQKGEVTARTEASYDQRLTQRLILQPRAEVNLSAQDVPELKKGSGFTSVELGLRLRYEIAREFAPYVGINWDRKLGATARYARADDENPDALRFVAGVRFWF